MKTTFILLTWLLSIFILVGVITLNGKMSKVLEEISSKQLLNDAVTANLMEF